MSRVSRAGVLAAYRDGVTVICELAAQFADATWLAATPCAEWRAVDLAGHLRCVADDYHEYLDDAPASRLARLMSTNAPADSLARKLARQNSAELAALPDAPGPEHIRAFADSARSYGRRLPLSWDLPHHRYRGTDVTVGAMAGAACAEWHLHAWDLARSLGKDYRPADPELVLAAWQTGMPQLWPVLTGGESGDPWHFLLTASGRDPGWLQVLEWCALQLGVIIQQRRVINGPRWVPRVVGVCGIFGTLPDRAVRSYPGPVRGWLAGAGAGGVRVPQRRPDGGGPALRDPALSGPAVRATAVRALQSGALQSEALHRATLTDWATAAGLAAVSLITLAAWVVAWRRRLRADGILAGTSRRQARREARAQRQRERDGAAPAGPTDPAQVLNELRALLVPLLAEPANGQAAPEPPVNGQARVQVTRGREPGDEPEEPGEPVSWHPGQDHDGPGRPVIPAARSGGLAAMESMLSGAELLMVSCGEEEAW